MRESHQRANGKEQSDNLTWLCFCKNIQHGHR